MLQAYAPKWVQAICFVHKALDNVNKFQQTEADGACETALLSTTQTVDPHYSVNAGAELTP